jgi:hypothetical protein
MSVTKSEVREKHLHSLPCTILSTRVPKRYIIIQTAQTTAVDVSQVPAHESKVDYKPCEVMTLSCILDRTSL